MNFVENEYISSYFRVENKIYVDIGTKFYAALITLHSHVDIFYCIYKDWTTAFSRTKRLKTNDATKMKKN